MRSVTIKIHYVQERRQAFSVPTDQLTALYRTASVDLAFVDGEDIVVDPNSVNAFVTYDDLVRRYGSTDTNSAHLIIGGLPPSDHREVAGQLLDLQTRGVAAAYTRHEYILASPRVHLLQTAAHEIGHLLNLEHPPQPEINRFDSTMNQIGNRVAGVAGCWERAALEAKVEELQGKPSYFMGPSRTLDCFPLGLSSRKALSDLTENSFRPWMSRFNHGGQERNDCPCVRRYG